MLFTLVAGSFLISVAGCVCMTLKIYYAMPPNLTSGLRYTFDFIVALAEFILKLAYIIILFVINIVTYVLSSILQFVPYLFKTFSSLLSFLFWILTQLIRGIFGMGDKTTNTLSWLFLLCSVYLYFDHKGYFFRSKTPVQTPENQDNRQNVRTQNNRTPRENRRNEPEGRPRNDNENARQRIGRVVGEQINANDRASGNQNQTDRLHEVQRPQAQKIRTETIQRPQAQEIVAGDIPDDANDDTQQLEAENRENENEANSQEEADRTRMRDDNVRNTERELYDGAAPPRAEENIDTTLCVICLDRERNVAVFPCGHTHLCLTCVQRLREENGLCPMCQRHIKEYRQIFV